MRLIEIVADEGHTDTLRGIADQYEITDYWWGAPADDGRRSFRMLVADDDRQPVMDAVQNIFGGSETHRIVVLPVDTQLPREPEDRYASAQSTREELYTQIDKGARIDSNYVLLVVLSTLVAAVGLIEDNVAVVIGAMVIAPLLGPIIALAFSSTLGDGELMWRAGRTAATGLGLALLISLAIGFAWPADIARGELLIASTEIVARTDVGLDGVVLALASGAAAVVSLTTGLSTTLVGVMVAVALLPPTATTGLLLGAGHGELAFGAALLLAVNIVCVMVAAKTVFVYKGVAPRTWLERNRARQSKLLSTAFWMLLLALLLVAVAMRHRVAV
ncbi:MAG: TIGR00341 family protein [Gammaproteobacteria bacterium]|nr:TIGR00341 family protein [Gammaproteobacteria bacterium]